jgi:hypothetical protein
MVPSFVDHLVPGLELTVQWAFAALAFVEEPLVAARF